MKSIAILFLSCLCCFAQNAATNTVHFFFQDSFGRPQALRKFTLQPVPNLFPATNNLGQITGDFISANTDASGNCTVSNVTAGTYRQVFYGPTVASTNYLLIPDTTNSIEARAFITVYPSGLGFILYTEAGVTGGRITYEP